MKNRTKQVITFDDSYRKIHSNNNNNGSHFYPRRQIKTRLMFNALLSEPLAVLWAGLSQCWIPKARTDYRIWPRVCLTGLHCSVSFPLFVCYCGRKLIGQRKAWRQPARASRVVRHSNSPCQVTSPSSPLPLLTWHETRNPFCIVWSLWPWRPDDAARRPTGGAGSVVAGCLLLRQSLRLWRGEQHANKFIMRLDSRRWELLWNVISCWHIRMQAGNGHFRQDSLRTGLWFM